MDTRFRPGMLVRCGGELCHVLAVEPAGDSGGVRLTLATGRTTQHGDAGPGPLVVVPGCLAEPYGWFSPTDPEARP